MNEYLKRTVFIGPVQAVEDYLNYTKISYFSPLELEERCLEKTGKSQPFRGFAHFP
jgi:hypothetical protein